jgi:signal peptidase I
MDQTKDKKVSDLQTVRDTVEGIWVAIVLALVLRAFVVEAFVIPTGSMAPRLMGEHYDLQCPACGYEYAFGWVAGREARLQAPDAPRESAQPLRGEMKIPPGACCPNCSYRYPSTKEYVNAGDRVLVLKYLYMFSPPQPWDVVVFRNPQNNRENYIKRFIGSPGETIEVIHGDIFYKSQASGDQWRVRRKTPRAQESIWQVVYDNDYLPDRKIMPADKRWEPSGSWKSTDGDRRVFQFTGGKGELTFAHDSDSFLPLYGYNAKGEGRFDPKVDTVTDLKVELVFTPQAADAGVGLALTSFDHQFRSTIAADGTIRVEHALGLAGQANWQLWSEHGLKIPPMQQGKGYRLALSHADFQLVLSVDGEVVFRSSDEQYSGTQNPHDWVSAYMRQPDLSVPMPAVKVSAFGGPGEISHLSLMRDVYYTRFQLEPVSALDPAWDYARDLKVSGGDAPWASMGNPIKLNKYDNDPDCDSLFVMGDNSPVSLDCRGWTKAAPTLRLWKDPQAGHDAGNALYQLGTVPRYNLIGKAFFVYWPSGFRVPGLEGLPILPNVGRMRLIR